MSGYEELIAGNATEAPAAETPPVAEVAPAPVVSEPAPSEAQAPPVETQAPAPVAEPQDPMAPVKALLDERERRQAAERRVAAFEASHREQERKRQEAAAQRPDMLEDPQGYHEWSERRHQARVQQAIQQVKQEQFKQVETLSRSMLVRHIGAEKVAEIEAFSRSAPKHAIDEAYASGDPYGWMFEKYEKAMEGRKAQEALKALGDKSLDDRIKEATEAAVAAAKAEWEAQRGGGQPPAAVTPPADTRARNPDGTFAPLNPTQRHQPVSLALVEGAGAPRGEEAHSGYSTLFKRG